MKADDHLALAQQHLERVQQAWDPPDWPALSMWGFYCLENAVMAAALHAGIPVQRNHPDKARAAEDLHHDHGLPPVAGLLRDLNDARKSSAYGDVPRPAYLDPEDVATQLEEYVTAVEALLAR